jgi:predicted nucleic-acid-binding protein
MAAARHESPRAHPKESSVLSLLSGWAQQGAQTLFATQRILIDLAMRQNASVMHAIRQQLSDPQHSPTAILSEVAGEGMTNFLEGQKVLLELGKEQNKLLMTGVKERVGDCPRRHAMVDLLRRSVDTFIEMQEEFLKIAGKQTHTWVDAAKAGKPYQPEQFVGVARESMENFVKAQKQFLDVISEETAKATGVRHANGAGKKIKQTELSELARKSTEAFIEAQKRLAEVAGRQVNANVKTAGKAMELLRPFPSLPLNELTREAVKSYVEAQKALMDVVVKHSNGARTTEKTERHARKPVKRSKPKVEVAVA